MVVTFLVAALLVAVVLTGVVRRYAVSRDLLDVPNPRSSHTVPTPRGGGLAIVATVLTGGLVLLVMGVISPCLFAGLFGAGVLVAGIGYLDDHRNVPARWRILVHFLAGALLLAFAGSLPPVPFLAVELVPGWGGTLLLLVFVVWLLNLYNFMDGIDGIAAVEAVTVCGCAAFLLWFVNELELALLVALYGAASLGFLVWNRPPAKIFMGDAGSGFLGFSLAGLMVLTWTDGGFAVWPWLILLGVFLVDATMTLIRRILRGEGWYEAHRSHAYQHAAREAGGHLPVTLVVGLANLLWLFPLAWLAVLNPGWGPAILLVAWAPLALLALRFRAGLPQQNRS